MRLGAWERDWIQAYQVLISVQSQMSQSFQNGVVLSYGWVPAGKFPFPWTPCKHLHYFLVPAKKQRKLNTGKATNSGFSHLVVFMVSNHIAVFCPMIHQGFIQDFELGGGEGKQDGSRMIACEKCMKSACLLGGSEGMLPPPPEKF